MSRELSYLRRWEITYAGSFMGNIDARTRAAAFRMAYKRWGGKKSLYAARQTITLDENRKNPTKAQKRVKAKTAATKRRVASALAKFLKQANPGSKAVGAKVQKLKGGVIKITPIKRGKR